MRLHILITATFLAIMLAGCASAGTPWVELSGTRYTVEVAADDAARAQGLMFRDSMPEDAGMLFIHDREEPQDRKSVV